MFGGAEVGGRHGGEREGGCLGWDYCDPPAAALPTSRRRRKLVPCGSRFVAGSTLLEAQRVTFLSDSGSAVAQPRRIVSYLNRQIDL